jgi:hypothetical protein
MEQNYRLEFNEDQQKFRLDNYTHKKNTYGWFTIYEQCSELRFKVYKSYVNRIKKRKLTKEYLLKCVDEIVKEELKTFSNVHDTYEEMVDEEIKRILEK